MLAGRNWPTAPEAGAKQLFGTIQRLKEFPEYLEILPGAYAGSVCGRALSGKAVSTIGFERRFNRAFQISTVDQFVEFMLQSIPAPPPNATAVRALNQGRSGMTDHANSADQKLKLGIRENLGQFSLLVLINAFVGGMVGLERTIVPLLGSEEFRLASTSAITAFIVSFGLTKALVDLVSGPMADRWGRKPVLMLGWLFGLPVPFLIIWAPSWSWIVVANVLLGMNQGFAWSMTVLMKIDLAGPVRRGLAMGLNEFAGYGAVGLTALLTGYIAASSGLRPRPFYLGIGYAVAGLLLSVLVRETSEPCPA